MAGEIENHTGFYEGLTSRLAAVNEISPHLQPPVIGVTVWRRRAGSRPLFLETGRSDKAVVLVEETWHERA